MNCNEFASHWQALVAETLDDETKGSMGEHARRCRDCGKRWEGHRELCTTIQSVLEDHRLAPNLADDVARKVYQEHFGTSLSAAAPATGVASGISLKTPGVALLLAALVGALAGYFMAGPRSQSALSQQLAYAQMMGATSGRGNMPQQLMLYGLMSGGPMGGTSIVGKGLPQITSTVRTLFFIFLLLWITRTKIWEVLFPSGVPAGIYVARWGAILAAILGVGRCISATYMTLYVFAAMSNGAGRQSSQAVTQWLPSLGVLDQLWAIAFWFTLMIVLFTFANQMTLGVVRGKAAGR